MLSVKIGVTNKKINSTSQFITGDTNLSCVLKEPTSMQNPVFQVQGLSKTVVYNYAVFLNRYYWVDDIVWTTNDIQEVHCHLDPLATFKTDIENTRAYVTFADSAHKTAYKDDERFGPDHKLLFSAGQGPTGSIDMGLTQSVGTFLVTIQNSGKVGVDAGVHTYAMTWATLKHLFADLTQVVASDVQSWTQGGGPYVEDFLNNWGVAILTGGQQALDNIRSIIYVPVDYSAYVAQFGSQSKIAVGPYELNLRTYTVSNVDISWTKTGNAVLNLARPLPNTTYKWLNSPKYCSIKVTHPCGVQEINDNSLLEEDNIYFWWSFSPTSGEYAIRVTSEPSKDSDTLSVITGTVGIDILNAVMPQGNVNMNSGWFNSILIPTTALGNISGNFAQGQAGPKTAGSAVPSGFAGYKLLSAGKEIFYDVEYYLPSIFDAISAQEYNEFCNVYGYVCGRYLRIGDISGYCQCSNASVGAGGNGIAHATEDDKSTINDYLNSGIFIEA